MSTLPRPTRALLGVFDVLFKASDVKGAKPDQESAAMFVRALYQVMLHRDPDEKGLSFYTKELIRGRSHQSILEEFRASDEFKAQAAAKLFVPPGHYYSPIVNTREADVYLLAREALPVPHELPGIALDQVRLVEEWQSLLPYLTTAPFPASKNPQFRYCFENPAYSWGDGSILHAMLRKYRPKRLIEVGSGWSSACIFDTVEQFLSGNCELTFIEPYPELLRELLGKASSKVRIFENPVQEVALTTFDMLEAGDFLFIDSTHVLRTGSDVCFELFDVLPRLAPGVLVHIHDMFWPFEYPRQWVVNENRSWNEIYAVRSFLSNNDAWDIVMFNHYLALFQLPMIEATYPTFLRNSGGALWLQRR